MILGNLWRTIQAQLNKLVDFFWAANPIAAMQQEYDRAVRNYEKAGSVWPSTGRSSSGSAARWPATRPT